MKGNPNVREKILTFSYLLRGRLSLVFEEWKKGDFETHPTPESNAGLTLHDKTSPT